VIEKEGGYVTISFLANRTAWFIPIFGIFGLCSIVIWGAFRLDWNGNIISGLVGGSISVCASICFGLAEYITRYVITIESDVVILQRELQGIPVGSKKIYSRVLVTDLGVYPSRHHNARNPGPKLGTLCIWAEGKSIEIERYFPIVEGVSLASDLRDMGIEFPRTYLAYDESQAVFARDSYLSF
jgi:hypothetical protein